MGLFSSKDPAGNTRSGKSRPLISSEAQAAEFRGRARRRLAGAVALVLAAIIILPMMLDSEPATVPEDVPIRIPERTEPIDLSTLGPQAHSTPDALIPPAGLTPQGATGRMPAPVPTVPGQITPVQAVDPAAANSGPATHSAPAGAQTAADTVKPPAKPESRPEPQAEIKPEPARNESRVRSDDGERALALLEGRVPAANPQPAAAKGNFVLQVASYSTQADAQDRRGQLHAAGITNAFVEPITIGGKQQYRLRVGPFPSRVAAQAAQARLRTLGYDNGFIATQ